MRKLLIAPACDRENAAPAGGPDRLIVFFKDRRSVTVFNVRSGREEEIPAAQVREYQRHIRIREVDYTILERLNHE